MQNKYFLEKKNPPLRKFSIEPQGQIPFEKVNAVFYKAERYVPGIFIKLGTFLQISVKDVTEVF